MSDGLKNISNFSKKNNNSFSDYNNLQHLLNKLMFTKINRNKNTLNNIKKGGGSMGFSSIAHVGEDFANIADKTSKVLDKTTEIAHRGSDALKATTDLAHQGSDAATSALNLTKGLISNESSKKSEATKTLQNNKEVKHEYATIDPNEQMKNVPNSVLEDKITKSSESKVSNQATHIDNKSEIGSKNDNSVNKNNENSKDPNLVPQPKKSRIKNGSNHVNNNNNNSPSSSSNSNSNSRSGSDTGSESGSGSDSDSNSQQTINIGYNYNDKKTDSLSGIETTTIEEGTILYYVSNGNKKIYENNKGESIIDLGSGIVKFSSSVGSAMNSDLNMCMNDDVSLYEFIVKIPIPNIYIADPNGNCPFNDIQQLTDKFCSNTGNKKYNGLIVHFPSNISKVMDDSENSTKYRTFFWLCNPSSYLSYNQTMECLSIGQLSTGIKKKAQ